MKYFENLTEIDAIKTRYKELAKKYHPDLGGDTEVMKEINKQYAEVLTGAYQQGGKSITEIEELLADSMEVAEKLCEIIALSAVTIEVCGEWLWVTGDTKAVKDKLKAAGFLWSSKKTAWYWRKATGKRRFRGTMDLASIRAKYGSAPVNEIRLREKLA